MLEVMPTNTASKRPRTFVLPIVAGAFGAILGFVVALLWSRSQVHMIGSYVLHGESLGRVVFAHAGLGAIIGGLFLSGIVVVCRTIIDRRRSSHDQDKLPQ
jgi:hypothetical protein